MVTFVCTHCDSTLKKKQVDTHTFGRCRPASFICIDCHTTFHGTDYKAHTSCLTQFEKHWGDYAKPNQKSKQNQPANNQVDVVKVASPKTQPQKIQAKTINKSQSKQKVETVQQGSEWKGWKNEIKVLVKQNNNKVQLGQLQKQIVKRYRKLSPEQDLNDEEIKQLFNDKVRKLKKVKLVTYVELE